MSRENSLIPFLLALTTSLALVSGSRAADIEFECAPSK